MHSEEHVSPKKKEYEELTPTEQQEFLAWIREENRKEEEFVQSAYEKIYGLTIEDETVVTTTTTTTKRDVNRRTFGPPPLQGKSVEGEKEVNDKKRQRHNEEGQQQEVVELPNTTANVSQFGWCIDGRDQVRAVRKGGKKQPGEETFLKEYYICSEKKKGGTCKAKKRVHHLPWGDHTECAGTHNHPPPQKLDQDVEKKITEYSKVGAKAAVIQSKIMEDAIAAGQLLTPNNVPTKQKIYNTQHKIAMEKLPTGDALRNLRLTHSPHFLRLLQLDPGISIVFVSANGLNVLANSAYVIVDGTFDLVEEKLVLTTLMGLHDEMFVPCAYYLSELKTHDSYLLFFKKIKELTNGRMDPIGCLLDFEEAMASAWIELFPKCSIMRDFFHLQQANTRKMSKIGLSDLRSEVVQGMRHMFYADTQPEFEARKNEFLATWDEKAPEYTTYFRRVWLGQHPPNSWASFARGKDAPSGSTSIEGHHNRIQNTIMPGFSTSAVDQFGNKLWAEETYYLNLMTTPHLWSEKKATHMAAVQRHLLKKRILLKDVKGSRTIKHHSSYSTTFSGTVNEDNSTTSTTTSTTTTSTSPFYDYASDDDGEFDLAATSECTPTLDSPPPPFSNLPIPKSTIHPFFQMNQQQPQPTPTTPPPRLDIPSHQRCKCGHYKFNQACTGKLCQKCCGNSMAHCGVTSHIKHKQPGYQTTKYKVTSVEPSASLPPVLPGVVDSLAAAMKAGKHVYIAYANRDPNEKKHRKVKPLSWVRCSETFSALCFIDNMEKTFSAHKILRIEDQPWAVAAPTTTTSDMSAAALPTSVSEWLTKMGLGQYWQGFKDNGYDVMEAWMRHCWISWG